MRHPAVTAGSALRLGAVADDTGVNFAVFSAHATAIEVCLFSSEGQERKIQLPARTGDIWHGHLAGVSIGQRYGFRASGPWAPQEGHLFNPMKLLIDPYARALDARLVWHPAMTGHAGTAPFTGAQPSVVDSAAVVPKSVVVADIPPMRGPEAAPQLIYEAHVKGLTQTHPDVGAALRGTYDALAAPAVLRHMRGIGVTHLELLPIAAFLDDRHVTDRRLVNYWGYQPIAMLAPEPRYMGPDGLAGLCAALRALKADGIGVILDVVFNHSGEGDAGGPTLCFRGLDNKSYYALTPKGENLNHAGTGNTLNLGHPMVLRLVMDALRHWAAMGVAGFRFDLATTLLRNAGGFDPGSAFLEAITQDPILNRLILIAEPWDLGPGGYRLGQFPAPFAEWNDRFRDGTRRFWRGDGGQAELARRLTGSAELFDRPGRQATASVNFLTSHDGFTLQDVVSFSKKHNLDNGEGNHDGHHDNCSDNMGVEGISDDPAVVVARDLRKRAMLATLFLAQGTPMLLAGDELGHSQRGNNNAYAQDTDVSWLSWDAADPQLRSFLARLARLRQDHPVIRQKNFLHGQPQADGTRDLIWRLPSGAEPSAADWDGSSRWALCCEIRSNTAVKNDTAVFAVFNAGADDDILLPAGRWQWCLDSANPDRLTAVTAGWIRAAGQAVQVFIRLDEPGKEN